MKVEDILTAIDDDPRRVLLRLDEPLADSDLRSLHEFLRRWTPRGTPRCGDIVVHNPSGEAWVVAYVDGDRLAACGWPFGEVPLADCTRVTACSKDEHRAWLERVAKVDDKRGRMARAALDALAADDNKANATTPCRPEAPPS